MEPIIRKEEGTERLHVDGWRKVIVRGGLHMIRGNKAPYFTIGGEFWGIGNFNVHNPDMCGCVHEEILKLWPELAPVVSMCLSDIDGEPMHAAANGWYYLTACLPEHGGERYFLEWREGKRHPLDVLAGHLRVSRMQVEWIRNAVVEVAEAEGAKRYKAGDDETPGDMPVTVKTSVPSPYYWPKAKDRFYEIVNDMRPRWKEEAESVVKMFGLQVFGDSWKKEEVEV